MFRIITILLIALGLAGCAKDGSLVLDSIPNSCSGTGHTFTWIKYGDSHLGALKLSEIGRKSEWRFRLQPDNPGGGIYSDKLVTISAKPSGPPQPWLSVSGKHSANPVLVLCVPDTLALHDVIEYMIEVEDVGMLDPRAEVVN